MNESPSYKKINFSLRPGKNIQRKMIAELCSCLRSFGRISSYRYIGFGSTFFSDFTLFHRILGFKNMISIEKEVEDKDRFEFNKPLGSINMAYGDSSDILSSFEWKDIPTIIWLDYDKQIDIPKLDDINFLAANLCKGSVLIVSLRALATDFHKSLKTSKRLAELRNSLGEKLPFDIASRDMTESKFPITLKRIIDANISRIISDRNAALPPDNHFLFRQLFFSIYNDGTRMATIGGIIIEKGQSHIFESCDFRSLDYFNEGNTPVEIKTPNLTFQEQRYLDSQIPDGKIELPCVTKEEVADYVKVYRHYPKFVEAEL